LNTEKANSQFVSNSTMENNNLFFDFVMLVPLIFWYALIGIKYLLFDIWVLVIHKISWYLSSSYKKLSGDIDSDAEIDLYNRTKREKKVKPKRYIYTKGTLKRYERLRRDLQRDLQMSGATRSKEANIYQYIAKNKEGKFITDTMAGFSKLDIHSFLINEGYEVYDIKTSNLINFIYRDSGLIGAKISIKDLVFWLTQLATYIKAGITLNEGVKILCNQMKNKKGMYKVLRSISYELTLGETFSNALKKQGNYFPALLINMIKAAEASGTLQETLEDMANYYTEVNNTKKEMKSALTYPAIITVFSITVITFIIIYVVPQFTKVYEASNIEIKGLTSFIIKLSDFLKSNFFLIILIIIAIMIFFFIAFKKIKAFRVACQIIFMKIPIIKDVIIYKEITIFAKTFSSLLRNNVYITESMDILSKITTNEIYKSIMFKTINNIVKGEKISDAFSNHWAIPDVAYYMIVTGESTGQLAEMMQKVSDYYQVQHKSIVSSLKSFIEPVMIVFLAVIVASIIVSVIVPMFQLYNEFL